MPTPESTPRHLVRQAETLREHDSVSPITRLIGAISKMFVVLVILLGNPPVVRMRDLARRPAVALVATARPQDGEGPLRLPRSDSSRRYIPVKAA
jgi:hypothetical protein